MISSFHFFTNSNDKLQGTSRKSLWTHTFKSVTLKFRRRTTVDDSTSNYIWYAVALACLRSSVWFIDTESFAYITFLFSCLGTGCNVIVKPLMSFFTDLVHNFIKGPVGDYLMVWDFFSLRWIPISGLRLLSACCLFDIFLISIKVSNQ